MNADIWGPHAWVFLHSITFSYDPKNKEAMKKFVSSLESLLPCEICREHFKQNLLAKPLTDEILSSKDLLFKWFVDLHNIVNLKNGKKTYSYAEVVEKYKNLYAPKEDYLSLFGIIVLMIVVILLIKKLNN